MPFVVDPTNEVTTHTPRNALRAQLDVVPGARTALARVAMRAQDRGEVREASLQSITSPHNACRPHAPHLGALTLDPAKLSPRLSPQEQRALLRELFRFVAPGSAGELRVTHDALERVRELIFTPSPVCSRASTPCAGVQLSRRPGNTWVFSRQPFRAHEREIVQMLRPGEWREWDGRLALRVTGDAGPVFCRASQRQLPILFRRRGEADEVVLRLDDLFEPSGKVDSGVEWRWLRALPSR